MIWLQIYFDQLTPLRPTGTYFNENEFKAVIAICSTCNIDIYTLNELDTQVIQNMIKPEFEGDVSKITQYEVCDEVKNLEVLILRYDGKYCKSFKYDLGEEYGSENFKISELFLEIRIIKR